MSASLRIGVDIDDVVYPWYATAHAISEAAGITNGNEPTSWAPFDQYGCTDQEWYDVLAEATLNGALYMQRPIPGAIEALERLHGAGHTIHLVTARGFLTHGTEIRLQTVEWLEALNVPHDTLTFSKRKAVVPTDFFIDDSEKNVLELANHGVRTYMMNQPHNQHVDYPFRVNHISEFVDEVLA